MFHGSQLAVRPVCMKTKEYKEAPFEDRDAKVNAGQRNAKSWATVSSNVPQSHHVNYFQCVGS